MMLLKILLLLLLAAPAYGAAPTYDTAASMQFDTVVEASIVGFTTAGSNRLLTSCLAVNEPSTLTAHHYNTTETMTSVLTANTGSANQTLTMYRLINPTTGAHDLTATFNDFVNGILGATSFADVHQTTPLGTAVKAEGALQSAGTTVTVTSATDDIVVDCFTGGATVPTEGAGQTERWDEELIGVAFGNGSTKAGAASVVMSRAWTPDSFEFVGLIGVSVKPVAGAPATAHRRVIIVQ